MSAGRSSPAEKSFGGMSLFSGDAEGRGLLARASNSVHNGLHVFFTKLTELNVNHPWKVICIVTLFTAAMSQGIWFYDAEKDNSKLFTPTTSRALREKTFTDAVFGEPERRVVIVFFAEGGNVLTPQVFAFMQRIHDHVVMNPHFNSVCARAQFPFEPLDSKPTCKQATGPLSLFANNYTLSSQADLQARLHTEEWGKHVDTGPPLLYYISQTGLLVEESGEVRGSSAMQMVFFFKNDKKSGERFDELAHEFEMALGEAVLTGFKKEAVLHGIDIEMLGRGLEQDASSSAIQDDMSVLILGYVLMICYSCFVLSRGRPKYSHALLGLASVLSIGMSTISAYGLCWYIGIKFNPVVQVLILVLLGVGIDDTFVIMDSWCDAAHIQDFKQRMVHALGHAGPAITVTSLTDLVAFLAGTSSHIPAIQTFCMYACLGITFDFMYQVTFFVSIAYFSSERQRAGRADAFCCIKVADNAYWPVITKCVPESTKKAPYREIERGLLHWFIGEKLPKFVIGTKLGMAVVAAVSCLIVGFGAYGCTEVKMNYNHEWFIPSTHRYQDALAVREKYFGGAQLPCRLVTSGLDFSSPIAQESILAMHAAISANEWVVPGSLSAWLPSFQEWVRQTHPTHGNALSNTTFIVKQEHFYTNLELWLSPTGPPEAANNVRNIAFKKNLDGSSLHEISATTDTVLIVDGPLSDGATAGRCLLSLRALMDSVSSGRTFVYSPFFLFWESYDIFFGEILKNVGIAAACVLIIVTVLEANLWIGLMVLVTVVCIDCCLLGFMYWLDVYINSISVICVVLAIGLAVDYSVHIAGAFLTVTATETEAHSAKSQRAAFAMWKMGAAVCNGGFSTFIAVAPLMFAKSFVFQVFFKMFFMIIAFGLWFGVLTLPLVLCLIGPPPRIDAASLDEEPWMNPLDPRFSDAFLLHCKRCSSRCIKKVTSTVVTAGSNPLTGKQSEHGGSFEKPHLDPGAPGLDNFEISDVNAKLVESLKVEEISKAATLSDKSDTDL